MEHNEVYGKLYDVVAANSEAAGGHLEYLRSTFLCDAGANPQVIDVARFLNLDNEAFFQALHVAALKRLPDEATDTAWRKRFDEPREQFRRETLHWIANSSVVAINQISIINNPYFEQHKGMKYHLMGRLYGLTDKSSLREFGKKLPGPIQTVIRRVFI